MKCLIESSLCLVVLTCACTPATPTENPIPGDMANVATDEDNTSPDDQLADETSTDVVDGEGVLEGQENGTDQPDAGGTATEDAGTDSG